MHILRTKTGRLFLVKHLTRKSKNATKLIGSQMMFILKKSVTIAARPYMRPAEQNAALYVKATDAFEAAVKEVLSKGAA
jgi:phage gpG-like protein